MFQIESGFVPVQYYTQSDPYYYTVDNRPLQNLATNDSVLASGVDVATSLLASQITITPAGSGVYEVSTTESTNRILTISGPATGVVLNLPPSTQSWIIVNNLSDLLTVSISGITGGVNLSPGENSEVFYDGTELFQILKMSTTDITMFSGQIVDLVTPNRNNSVIVLTGTLTAPCTAVFPSGSATSWIVSNKTNETVAISYSGSSSFTNLESGYIATFYTDGTNMVGNVPAGLDQANTFSRPQVFSGTIDVLGTDNETPFAQYSDFLSDFIIEGLSVVVPSPASLTASISTGAAVVLGQRTVVNSIPNASNVYAASSDTYVSLSQSGIVAYTSVSNGSAAPAAPANAINLLKVVTDSILSPTPTLTAANSGTLASGTYQGALVAYDATGYGAVGTSVSVTVSASGSIEFSWVNPLNETSMDIYVTPEGSTTLGLVASGVTGTSYTYTGSVTPGAAPPTTATSNAIQRVSNLMPELNERSAMVVTPEMFGGTDYTAFNAASDWLWENNYGGQIYVSKRYVLGAGNVNLAPNVSIVGCLHGAGDIGYLNGITTAELFNLPSCLIIEPDYTINVGIGGSVAQCYLLSSTAAVGSGIYNGNALTSIQTATGDYTNSGSPAVQNVLALGFNNLWYSEYTQRVRIKEVNLDCFNGISINHSHDICLLQDIHGFPFLTNTELRGTLVTINGGSSSWHQVYRCSSVYWYTTIAIIDSGEITIANCGSDGAFVGAAGAGVSFVVSGSQYTTRFINCRSTASVVLSVDVTGTSESNPAVIINGLDIWGPTGNGIFDIADGYVEGSYISILNSRADFGTISSPGFLKLRNSNITSAIATIPNKDLFELESYGSLKSDITFAGTTLALANNAYGRAVTVNSANAVITLPTFKGVSGQLIYFYSANGTPYSVVSQSDQFIFCPSIGLNSITGPITLEVTSGQDVLLMSRGNGEFDVIGGGVLGAQALKPNGIYQSSLLSVSSTTTAGDITASAAQLVGGYLADGATQTAAFTVTTDTAVNILAALPNAVVGTAFKWRFINNDQSTTGYAGTLAAGTGVTIGTVLPNPAVPKGGYADYVFTFTAIGSSPTLTVECVGGNGSGLL